jgi:hypothetical protein
MRQVVLQMMTTLNGRLDDPFAWITGIAANEQRALEWHNAELVTVRSDDEIVRFVNELKSQSGGDLHLAGGARLAQTSSGSGWSTCTASSSTRRSQPVPSGSIKSTRSATSSS